ncbi:MAG: hypothetical protein LC808_04500 [Actinobacteria bacterium]|nr:hypothetical protein [Actinomycetota bacterium]
MSTPRPEVARSRARLAALTRHRPADDPAVADAARTFAAERAARPGDAA